MTTQQSRASAGDTASALAGMDAFPVAAIDALFADLDQGALPGAAVGIAIAGTTVYRKAFGLANMELPVRLTPTIRLRIGSVSKQFTALGYLLLCEKGLANLDDPIGRHVPQLGPVTSQVSVRQLLGHLSGLVDAVEILLLCNGPGRAISTADIVALYAHDFEASRERHAAWMYNNGGYVLVAAAIEAISGQSLEAFLAERIFTPVGMSSTLLRRFDSDFVANSATLHMGSAAAGFSKTYLGAASAGQGGLVSSVDDMLCWLAHMDAPVVGSAASWQAMRTPAVLSGGCTTHYGLGLIAGDYRGVATLSHPGGVMGGNAQVLKMPEAQLDVVVLVNRHDVSAVERANRILDLCVPNLSPPATEAAGAPLEAAFASDPPCPVVRLFARQGQQWASLDGAEIGLFRTGHDRFEPAPAWNYLNYAFQLGGPHPDNPEWLDLSVYGDVQRLARLPLPGAADAELASGRYRLEGTGISAAVSPGGGLVTEGPFGRASYALEPLSAGVWCARSLGPGPWSGVVTAAREGFRFSGARSQGLLFRKVGA